MQSQQTGWLTLICVACLLATGATICMQPLQNRSRPPVTVSMASGAKDSGTDGRRFLKGANHRLSITEGSTGIRFSVTDLEGQTLASNMTLKELEYEYPKLREMVKSNGAPATSNLSR